MNIENLKNPEFQEKLKNAQTAEDLITLTKTEGIELPDELLEQISGGGVWGDSTVHHVTCRVCGQEVTWTNSSNRPVMCPYCGGAFNW